jgi:FkbM family methyltransferase
MTTPQVDNVGWTTYDGSNSVMMRHGFELYLRPNCEYSQKRFNYRVAESNELDYLKSQNLEEFICLDVGANIGYWSKFLVYIGKVASLHSFEPDPVTCKILQKNLLGSGSVVNQAAISDFDGVLDLFINPTHSGDNRPVYTKDRLVIKVPCYTLDAYVERAKLSRLDFVKIDIQGGEIPALDGAIEIIKKFKPLLLVEIMPELNTEGRNVNEYIFQFCEQYHYGVYKIEKNLCVSLGVDKLANFSGNVFLKPR